MKNSRYCPDIAGPNLKAGKRGSGEAGRMPNGPYGLRPNWNPFAYSALFSRHPAVVASVVYRDPAGRSDDALIVVPLTARAHVTLLQGSKARNVTWRLSRPGSESA